MLSMGLAWRRGERLWENLRVSYFSRLLSQLNVATRPDNRVKKVKSNCCGSLILNYVFMNLHNSLSAAVLLFKAQSGNCERGWGGGGRGMEKHRGWKRGKVRLNQRRVTNCMKWDFFSLLTLCLRNKFSLGSADSSPNLIILVFSLLAKRLEP